MNFVRIDLPHDQVPKFIPIAKFPKRKDAMAYAHKTCHDHQIIVRWDVCQDGSYAVYVDAEREAFGADFHCGHGTIVTPPAQSN